MNILEQLNEDINVVVANISSTKSEIEEMLMKSPIIIPNEYIEIISQKSELEISIKNEKILRIWGATGCVEMNEAYNIQTYLPDSWAIGDDEGGYAIVYSKNNDKIGVYAISFGDLDENEKIFIASSLFELLVKGVGSDTFLSF